MTTDTTNLTRFLVTNPRAWIELSGRGQGIVATLTHNPEDPSRGVSIGAESSAPTIDEALQQLDAAVPVKQTYVVVSPLGTYKAEMGRVMWWSQDQTCPPMVWVGAPSQKYQHWSPVPAPVFTVVAP